MICRYFTVNNQSLHEMIFPVSAKVLISILFSFSFLLKFFSIFTLYFSEVQIMGIVGFVAQRVSSYFHSSFSPAGSANPEGQ